MNRVTVYATGSCSMQTREGSSRVLIEQDGLKTVTEFTYQNTTAKRPHCAAISSLVRPFRQDFDDDSYNQHRQANCNNAFMPGFVMKEPVAA